MQELAKRNFENLRQDSDDNKLEPEPKVVRRGRPPTKNLKRPPGRPPLERANSDFSEATPPKTGVNNNRSNIDTRKGTPLLQQCGSTDLFAQSFYSSHYGETYSGWSAERCEKTVDMTSKLLMTTALLLWPSCFMLFGVVCLGSWRPFFRFLQVLLQGGS